MEPSRPPGGNRATTLFILVFLTLQLLLPLRGFVYDKFDTRGNFTWNMYSRNYRCFGAYELTDPQGETRAFDYLGAFNRRDGAGKITHRDRLPRFHEWMCDRIGEAGDLGTLRGYVACSLNDGPLVDLVQRDVDLCTADNYGVRTR